MNRKAFLQRTNNYFTAMQRRYPGFLQAIDEAHLNHDGALWPQWCYLPLSGIMHKLEELTHHVTEIDQTTRHMKIVYDASVLMALSTWRLGKDTVTFDPILLQSLWDTPVSGPIPAEVLLRLPTWGLYLTAPPQTRIASLEIFGAFVHLDKDPRSETPELRLLLDTGDIDRMVSLPLPLVGSIEDGLMSVMAPLSKGDAKKSQYVSQLRQFIEPFLSLLLYVASPDAEWGGPRPTPAGPKEIRKARHMGKIEPRVWILGTGLGAKLRNEQRRHEQTGNESGKRASPRPHLRRAHWHTFLTGPRTQPVPEVRWIPPLVVGQDIEDAPVHEHYARQPT